MKAVKQCHMSPAALRSQLEAAESRLEAERKAHQSTKVAAATREHELEARLAGGGSALSDMQRALEEAGSRARGEISVFVPLSQRVGSYSGLLKSSLAPRHT